MARGTWAERWGWRCVGVGLVGCVVKGRGVGCGWGGGGVVWWGDGGGWLAVVGGGRVMGVGVKGWVFWYGGGTARG